ncbi:MAG: hypothetical protein R3181_06605 [Rubricoccaceae bacterium]|nr:hypothetical protein [Rubricoccaceae bacterium]
MDSSPHPRPRPAAAPPTAAEAAPPTVFEAPPGVVARVQRLVPLVQGLVRQTRRLAAVSAVSAVVLWLLVVRPWRWGVDAPDLGYALPIVGLLLLLVPAGAALLGAWTLADLLSLPARLRAGAAATSAQAQEALATPGHGRLFGFARAVWGARALVLDAQGGWLKALAAVRLARLASLPFALALIGAVALNAVVIAAAVLAVLLAVVF